MNRFEILKSQRGTQILVYENYMFNLNYCEDGTRRWRCQNRSCKGALFLNNEKVINKYVGHSHPPVPKKF
jgi:hypothetical protein